MVVLLLSIVRKYFLIGMEIDIATFLRHALYGEMLKHFANVGEAI